MHDREAYWQRTTVVTEPMWGDAGKGKLVDEGAQYSDVIVRYNGGPNAGHTVKNEHGTFALHLVSSGIFNRDALCVTTPPVLVNPVAAAQEIARLKEAGIPISANNLLFDKRSHAIFEWHKKLDAIRDGSRGKDAIGTTRQGVGEAASDRYLRRGFVLGDLVAPDFETRFDKELVYQEGLAEFLLSQRQESGAEEISQSPLYDHDALLEQLREARESIGPLLADTQPIIFQAERDGKNILGEGAQGALLDLDLGGYPYVTSSNPGLAGFSRATGIYHVGQVFGVLKAYSTRVGAGPMPTELKDAMGDYLRNKGGEYGATTGRPRRVGWLDAVAGKYGADIAGVNGIALTKLDILDGVDPILMAVGYDVDDGHIHRELTTADPAFMNKAVPIYEALPGWNEDTSQVREYQDLPDTAKYFIKRIEEVMERPVDVVSVGPHREQTIYRPFTTSNR